MFEACTPYCWTHPAITSSTSAASTPERSMTAANTAPSSSFGCRSLKMPFSGWPRPMGVRTASTTTTSRPSSLCIGMAGLPCVGCAPGGFGAAATHTRPRCGTLPPALTDESTPLPERLGVVGSGTIACGLAKVAAQIGDVVLYARSDRSADRARGRLGDCGAEVVTDLKSLAESTFVFEAVVEEHDAKSETYRELDPILDDATILTSSTSSLSVTSLAETSGRPDRFAGFHVFNPV